MVEGQNAINLMTEQLLNKYVNEVMQRLSNALPFAKSELNSVNSYTFLVSVVLSAQTTDKSVNKVTETLFKIANTPEQMLNLGCDNLKNYIKHLGLFNTKAKHIIELSEILVNKYDSKVPLDRNLLEQLPGVGRKTANVVLNHLCNSSYIAVDTHVKRLSHRLHLSNNTNLRKIEDDLYKIIPAKFHSIASNLLVLHGRYTCTARNPKCNNCILNDLCLFRN